MPGFDTSNVAAEVGQGQQPPNPLATIGTLATTVNALNQNKMFQAKQIAGQYLEQSIGPNGQPDPAKLNQFLSADPRTAPAASEIMKDAFGIQGAGITNQTNQQGLRAKQFGTLQSLMAQTSDPSQIPDVVTRAVAAGLVDPETAANALGGNIQGLDPTSLATMRKQALMGAGNQAELDANIGRPAIQNLGGNVTTLVTKPTLDGTTVEQAGGAAGTLPLTLSPEAKAAGVNVIGPDGTQTRQPVSNFVTPTGEQRPGVAPPQVGFAPGVEQAAATAGAGNANQGLTLQTQAAGVPQRKALLDNLRDTAGQFAAGPQSGFWKGMGSLASEYGIPLPGPVSANANAAQQEFDKLSIQVLAAQRAQMGLSSTDTQTSMVAGATPNERMTPEGIHRVLGVMEGNEDYLSAQNQAWQKWQPVHGAGSYGQFVTEFNKRYDPRVFQGAYMAPEERAVMLKGMTPAEKALFQSRTADAQKRGLISGQ